MKKFIFLFSTLFFSLILVNNVYAQDFVENPQPLSYSHHSLLQENAYTYEYVVTFSFSYPIIDFTEESGYILVNNIDVVFRKGINRNTNSYEYLGHIVTIGGYTEFDFVITVLKSIVDSNYQDDITPLFENDIQIYIDYYIEPINPDYELGFRDGLNVGYNNGYDKGLQEGYDEGYNTGYNEGYTDGARASQSEAYQRGYNEGARDSFISKIDIWIVPAIIVVVIAGIFVGYRRERYFND